MEQSQERSPHSWRYRNVKTTIEEEGSILILSKEDSDKIVGSKNLKLTGADEQPLQAHLRNKSAKEPSAEESGVSPWLRSTPPPAGLSKLPAAKGSIRR